MLVMFRVELAWESHCDNQELLCQRLSGQGLLFIYCLLLHPSQTLVTCQEALNRRLPVCCFGSVRNPLVLINS